MRLYLVRHGDATGAEENPRRPLSAKGRDEVERMASFLARSGVRPRRVIHSGKLRAGETAAILARALAPGGAGRPDKSPGAEDAAGSLVFGACAPGLMLEESEGLGPEDSPDKLIAAANAWAEAALDGRGGESRRASKDAPLPGCGGASAAASDVLVVGHMPFMARALSQLVGADAAPEFAAFASGAVACLETDEGRWRLLWLVAPELLGG